MGLYTAKEQNSMLKAYNMLLYFSGSLVMSEPVEECVVDFWAGGILKSLPIRSSNPRFIKAASQLRHSCKDKTICRKNLQEDFRRLFAGIGVPLAPPVESEYIDLLTVNESKKEKLSDFYHSYGWHKRSKYDLPDDNLGLELLFLTILNDKYIDLDDEACRREMRNDIKRFITNHILSWLPQWYERMQEYSATLCYKGIATLIFASCEDIVDLLEDPYTNQKEFTTEFRN